MREREHRSARNREQIMAREAIDRTRTATHRGCGRRVGALPRPDRAAHGRADDVAHRLQETREQLAAAEAADQTITARLADQDAEVGRWSTQLTARRQELERWRAEFLENVKRSSHWANEITLHDTQHEAAQVTLSRCSDRLEKLSREQRRQARQLEAAQRAESSVAGQLAAISGQVEWLNENSRRTSACCPVAAMSWRCNADGSAASANGPRCWTNSNAATRA